MNVVSERQRKDIIINQLVVANVVDEKTISVISKLQRSLFLDKEIACLGNSDSAIEYKKNRFMIDSATMGNMIEMANFKSSDIVLLVGTGLGYGAAIISKFVQRVICIEKDEELVELAQENLNKLGITNVEVHSCCIEDFNLIHPFNRVFFEGAFYEIPASILKLLDNKTDLIGIERKNNLSKIINAKLFNNQLVIKYGRHTPTPYMKGFGEKEVFSF